MSGDTLIDAHDKGPLIGKVVITEFFSDCIWMKNHLGHMSNEKPRARLSTARCDGLSGLIVFTTFRVVRQSLHSRAISANTPQPRYCRVYVA